MFRSITLLAFLSLGLLACSNQSKESSTPSTMMAGMESPTNQVLGAYFQVKNALVESDSNRAGKASQEFSEVLSQIDEAEPLEPIETQVDKLKATERLEAQREVFEALTEEVYVYCKTKSEKEKIKVYKQYCPMAFDFKGASWLSDSKEIANPYFGDKMLKCGKVTEEL